MSADLAVMRASRGRFRRCDWGRIDTPRTVCIDEPSVTRSVGVENWTKFTSSRVPTTARQDGLCPRRVRMIIFRLDFGGHSLPPGRPLPTQRSRSETWSLYGNSAEPVGQSYRCVWGRDRRPTVAAQHVRPARYESPVSVGKPSESVAIRSRKERPSGRQLGAARSTLSCPSRLTVRMDGKREEADFG
jgi:hypothetical protein